MQVIKRTVLIITIGTAGVNTTRRINKKSRRNTAGFLVDLEGFEPLTSRMRTERSPNSLAFVHTLCNVRKEK